MTPVYVITGRRPGLDSVAAALGLAWLLAERGDAAEARRGGPLSVRTRDALGRRGLPAPPLLLSLTAQPTARVLPVDAHAREEPPDGIERAELFPSPAPDGSFSASLGVAAHLYSLEKAPPAPLAGLLLDGAGLREIPRSDEAVARWLGALCDEPDPLAPRYQPLVSPAAVLDADCRRELIQGRLVALATFEAETLDEVLWQQATLLDALALSNLKEGHAFFGVLVTTLAQPRSILLAHGERHLLDALPFPEIHRNVWDTGTILSRRKQLLPILQAIIESAR